MPIFKVRSKGSTVMEGKLVGVYIPLQVSSYLSLYVLAHGVTKSFIVRDLIDEWYRDKRISTPEDELLEKVIHDALTSRTAQKSKFQTVDFNQYKQDMKSELKRKGITTYYIEIILKRLQDEEDKKSNTAE